MSDDNTSPSRTGNWVDKIKQLFTQDPSPQQDGLIEKLRDAEHGDRLDSEAIHIIEGALQVSNMQARDIMIPRSQMVCIASSEAPADFIPRIIAAGHSRYPVIGESTDEIAGILLAKDLLPLLFQEKARDFFNFEAILRPAIFVPESKRLTILLKEFRKNRNHIAIVADEYGGVAGLVTIEDVLEEIVGEIEDEYDAEPDSFIKTAGKGIYMVKALTPIEDFNAFFHSKLNDDEFDTIGGLIMKNLGHMPKRNESTVIDKFCFKITNADSRRIRLLQVSLKDNQNTI